MLNGIVTGELGAVLRLHADESMALPCRLLLVVLELDGEASLDERRDQRLDAGRVVVPAASVHVGAVLQDQRHALGSRVLALVERIVGLTHGVCAGHGCVVAGKSGVLKK